MSPFSCEDEVKSILSNLPSEGPCIDYKAIPYAKGKYHDFIKDVIGFLNCEENRNNDRYIIIGVTNDKERTGIKPTMPPMPDDCIFQDLVNMIRPHPFVHAGTVEYDGLWFGYCLTLVAGI